MQDQALLGGEGIDISAFVFEFRQDLHGSTIFGALKKQMLQKMG
jgi:hypothetical protein